VEHFERNRSAKVMVAVIKRKPIPPSSTGGSDDIFVRIAQHIIKAGYHHLRGGRTW
jgi:hypothetical protein